ncbi:MAG: phosphotransferase [Lachnospiraceae bacterium]|nr:phosphotransferase [Lachnospiraceae bacterium]
MKLEMLNKICVRYNLGELRCKPTRLTGGFMHKMYSLFTTKGKYAVKLLNPYVMQRETAMGNFRTAEALEKMLEEKELPIVPALTLDGNKMQCLDGQYFYLYEWYDGKALKSEEITEWHCKKIGGLLATIHGLDKRSSGYERDELRVDWDGYIEKLFGKNNELHNLLKEHRELLYESQEKGNAAIKKLPTVTAICHNDMDSKNVLWHGEDFRVIDLECLSYASPMMELYELALCWSGYETCNIDFDLFRCFIRAYAEQGGTLPTDWETIYYSNNGRLEWLLYNVKRALGIECTEEEIEIGASQVKETMEHVIYYHKAKKDILECLMSME